VGVVGFPWNGSNLREECKEFGNRRENSEFWDFSGNVGFGQKFSFVLCGRIFHSFNINTQTKRGRAVIFSFFLSLSEQCLALLERPDEWAEEERRYAIGELATRSFAARRDEVEVVLALRGRHVLRERQTDRRASLRLGNGLIGAADDGAREFVVQFGLGGGIGGGEERREGDERYDENNPELHCRLRWRRRRRKRSTRSLKLGLKE